MAKIYRVRIEIVTSPYPLIKCESCQLRFLVKFFDILTEEKPNENNSITHGETIIACLHCGHEKRGTFNSIPEAKKR
ncbi:MAG: hypothetical protein COU51_01305 [Parcubacteria group bacterium CG10_big_fil_rev_8_21_14_0_10_36_14]|nr:MAG: hypothetical protein COU51_01305 [Parcubacteria group bacterium CG10_big_fil_rev_8_21_14_0_10_36_14]